MTVRCCAIGVRDDLCFTPSFFYISSFRFSNKRVQCDIFSLPVCTSTLIIVSHTVGATHPLLVSMTGAGVYRRTRPSHSPSQVPSSPSSELLGCYFVLPVCLCGVGNNQSFSTCLCRQSDEEFVVQQHDATHSNTLHPTPDQHCLPYPRY
jgi:hypothetical protein